MKCKQKSWVLRVDPKDPNGELGMNIQYWTPDEGTKDAYVKDGIPLGHLCGPWLQDHLLKKRVRVKWVFTLETVDGAKV